MDADRTAPHALFQRALGEGRFLIQRCRETGRAVFYPRVVSPYTGKPSLDWIEASGAGTVYSTTVVRRRAEQGGDYNVALVDLAEGVRMMTCVVGVAADTVAIGMAVQAEIEAGETGPRVVFRPIAEHG